MIVKELARFMVRKLSEVVEASEEALLPGAFNAMLREFLTVWPEQTQQKGPPAGNTISAKEIRDDLKCHQGNFSVFKRNGWLHPIEGHQGVYDRTVYDQNRENLIAYMEKKRTEQYRKECLSGGGVPLIPDRLGGSNE